jgi:site-specific recombinase XerC
MRDALKDRSYRATPLGLEVARYYRWKKNEWGATKQTLRDYEAILAKLAIFHADLELRDLEPPVGTERLRECWDYHWGERSARTRAKARSVWVDFFDWAIRERGLRGNPARALASPKKRAVKRDPFPPSFVERVIAGQDHLADRLGCRLVLEYALRRSELADVQIKSFDIERRRLTVTGGKGGTTRVLPIVEESFWRDLGALTLLERLGPDSYLLYSTDRRKIRCEPDEAEESLNVGRGRTIHYRYRTLRDFSKPKQGTAMHRWWYGCLERADLVDPGVTSGLHMHRGRHTVATEILRRTGNLAAAKEMLGHKDIKTTIDAYAQFDDTDLERVLKSIRGITEDE